MPGPSARALATHNRPVRAAPPCARSVYNIAHASHHTLVQPEAASGGALGAAVGALGAAMVVDG